MPETASVHQAITIKQQNNAQTAGKFNTNATLDITQQMRDKIYAEHLKLMRGALGM